MSTLGRTIALLAILGCGWGAAGQVILDTDSETVRKLAGKVYLADLSVGDVAVVYNVICVKDGALYMPGWTLIHNLALDNYKGDGVAFKVSMLPANQIALVIVDERQAQLKAQGDQNAKPVLSNQEYSKALIDQINDFYDGGFLLSTSCDDLQRLNPLRKLVLYAVKTINGYSSISKLISHSFNQKAPRCKNGDEYCKPWERDWSKGGLGPGDTVTDEGNIEVAPPQ
jgi:hypothetical protein